MPWQRVRLGLAALLALGLLAAAAAALTPAPAGATEPQPGENLLSVTGTGTVEVTPDTARITLGVSAGADKAEAAYAQAAATLNRVVAALRERGVQAGDIATSTLHLHAEYDRKEGGQRPRGYRTTATVTVTTRRLDQVGALIDAAVAAGANQVQGVTFLVRDENAHVEAALDKAVDDARAKAERVARRLGTRIVGVKNVQITTPGRHPAPIIYGRVNAAAEDTAMPVLPGTTDYTVTVQVTFKLE